MNTLPFQLRRNDAVMIIAIGLGITLLWAIWTTIEGIATLQEHGRLFGGALPERLAVFYAGVVALPALTVALVGVLALLALWLVRVRQYNLVAEKAWLRIRADVDPSALLSASLQRMDAGFSGAWLTATADMTQRPDMPRRDQVMAALAVELQYYINGDYLQRQLLAALNDSMRRRFSFWRSLTDPNRLFSEIVNTKEVVVAASALYDLVSRQDYPRVMTTFG